MTMPGFMPVECFANSKRIWQSTFFLNSFRHHDIHQYFATLPHFHSLGDMVELELGKYLQSG